MQNLLGQSRTQYLGFLKKVVALPPVYGIANIRSGYCSKQRLLGNINSVYTVCTKLGKDNSSDCGSLCFSLLADCFQFLCLV